MGARSLFIGIALITLAWAGPLFLGGVLSTPPSLEAGATAPEFEAVEIGTGREVSLEDYDGDVVLLNIWATWCAPCREEMPAMERLHQELEPDGLEVVAVSVDADRSEVIQAFADRYGITFDVLHDRRQDVATQYQVFALPQSYVIDRRGKIASRHFGAVAWDDDRYRERIRGLVARRP